MPPILPATLAQADPDPSPLNAAGAGADALAGRAADTLFVALDGLRRGDLEAAWPLVTGFLVPAGVAVALLVGGAVLAKVASGFVAKAARRARIEETLVRFAAKLVFYAVFLLGVLTALGYAGIPMTSFAAMIAAAGFAIGLALSGTLQNFAAGVMLLVFRPFKVGDVVSAAGLTAKVDAIELFTTTFDTFDNRRILVPNGEIYGAKIENVTFHEHRRVEVPVGVAYDADLDRTREVLNAAADSLAADRVDGEGRGHQVFLDGLGDSAVAWKVRFWTEKSRYWPVHEALTRAVKTHLDAAGLAIPFPQMDVRVIRPRGEAPGGAAD
ncbi:mechanosensitive ion channel family protein [Phycisphaera mikurensis]|uniref:Putative small-conductance mechanosensitive channel n=1 Tax=Phycisphaera mikurensis (strain NBRC 102666 / KCTC 22515 / FYK2301M01) TaxID=1142394 RepID=I0IAC5_PHYMF|nr:mechanosensitive ion channel domain-containing protein [Phycisphaera mikurensis]MBB6441788.1 small conductance mechanosensitive channel [Phycisphaera mikurensis]BAM02213.1 putative small-conductance mechanosensitive channel [Phycisphaera mikurensis NBRC 102666]